jgi:uncharacterized protein YkwD
MADRETSAAAPPRRWASRLLVGLAIAAVLAGGTLYLARGTLFPAPAPGRATARPLATASPCGATATSTCAGDPAYVAVAGQPAVVTVPAQHVRPVSSASSPTPSPHPAATATTTTAASASAPGAGDASAAAEQVLALINQARSAAGLPALTITTGLETSSSAHNLLMADGCGLSHQCPGEPPLGNRETAAGVDWTAAGENIGEGGAVADTSAAIAQMAVGITQSMLNEKPPDDGHRMNILSTTFTHIGIAVYRDSSGTVWLTQDFSN